MEYKFIYETLEYLIDENLLTNKNCGIMGIELASIYKSFTGSDCPDWINLLANGNVDNLDLLVETVKFWKKCED